MFSPEARKEAPASERAVEKSLPSGGYGKRRSGSPGRGLLRLLRPPDPGKGNQDRPGLFGRLPERVPGLRGSLLPAPGRRRQFRVNHCFPGRPAVPETGERLAVPGSEEYPAIPVPGVWTAFPYIGGNGSGPKVLEGFLPPGQGRKKRRPHGRRSQVWILGCLGRKWSGSRSARTAAAVIA